MQIFGLQIPDSTVPVLIGVSVLLFIGGTLSIRWAVSSIIERKRRQAATEIMVDIAKQQSPAKQQARLRFLNRLLVTTNVVTTIVAVILVAAAGAAYVLGRSYLALQLNLIGIALFIVSKVGIVLPWIIAGFFRAFGGYLWGKFKELIDRMRKVVGPTS